MKRLFTDLPPHDKIRITGKIYAVDTWDISEYDFFFIYADG